MSADLEQARVAARGTESPHLLGNYEGLRSDPQALVGLLATADKRTDAVIRDVGDVRVRLLDDPNLPPVQLPPVVAFRALSVEHLLRDLAHELDAHVRLELRLPGGERRTRWAQPDGRVLAFDPLDLAAPGRSALTSQEAQDAGLISPGLRRAVDELGFDSAQLGAVYRTSWRARRTFAAAMYEEVENRRSRMAEIDPRLPELPRRAGASADEPKTPPGPNTESADATPEIRAVLDELPALAGETEPTGSERLAALLEAAETLLGPAPVVRAPEPHQVLRDGPLTVDEPATGLAGEVRGETDDRATAGAQADGAPEDSTGEGAPAGPGWPGTPSAPCHATPGRSTRDNCPGPSGTTWNCSSPRPPRPPASLAHRNWPWTRRLRRLNPRRPRRAPRRPRATWKARPWPASASTESGALCGSGQDRWPRWPLTWRAGSGTPATEPGRW
ncbi:hypothetical protein ACFVW1_14245 [Streptomyces olivochromogenes]|uniref:hypothetical protein n=1 Tax=Streptomyces olivochromogenes TaxID=1963 RepID=UPI0036DF32EB